MPSITLTRGRTLLLVVVVLALVFGTSRVLGSRSTGKATVESIGGGIGSTGAPSGSPVQGSLPPDASARGQPGAEPASVLVVDVAGAVRRPGLYRLAQGARIADAIARAGGATKKAAVALVNLAAPLADGEQVLVPSRAAAGADGSAGAAAGAAGAPSPAAPVDLNSASVEQLDTLPGIGPVTAQKIVDYRSEHGPFRSVDDLDAIPGIGPARIADLRGLVVP